MSNNRPNVVFFFTDDQRFDTIRALGNELVVTPTMDELTRRGVSFTRAHIMGSYTGAVCIASRSMMLTGRSLWRSPQAIPDDAPLWPMQMGEAGYTTFMTGKWHNDRQSFARGWTAVVDGEAAEIFRADLAWRGVPLEKGRHTVRFAFHQPGLAVGALTSGVGFLLGVGLMAGLAIRRP